MTRIAAVPEPRPSLTDSADDGWAMSARREEQVMTEAPNVFEPIEPSRPLPTRRGLVSAAEIEALLRPDLSDLEPDAPRAAPADPRPLANFAEPAPARSPDNDTGRRFAARLSMAMRESCGVPVAAIATATARGGFETAVKQSDEERGQAIACFASRDGDIAAMLVLAPGIAQLLIETACGARGAPGPVKPLSPIDLALLEALLRPLGGAISSELSFSCLETDAVFAASIAPPAEAVVIDLSLRIQAEAFGARLIVVEGIAAPLQPQTLAKGSDRGSPGALATVLSARIASLAVPLSKLSGLKPGSTLLLGVPADQPIELLSGGEAGVLAAEAEIGRRGNRVALRITRRGSALGPSIRARA